MTPFSVYVKRGSRRLFYPTLSIIGMVLVHDTCTCTFRKHVVHLDGYYLFQHPPFWDWCHQCLFATWNIDRQLRTHDHKRPRAWLRFCAYFSFLVDVANYRPHGDSGDYSIPYKRMTERVLYAAWVMLAENKKMTQERKTQMLTKMRIQCSGQLPEPTNTTVLRMTWRNRSRNHIWCNVPVNTDNGNKPVFECEPQDFKPYEWKRLDTNSRTRWTHRN